MNVRTFAAFVIGLAAAGAVSAQSDTLRAKIPFSFVVNGKTLPAGEYTLWAENSSSTMTIRGVDHRLGAVTVVFSTSTRPTSLESPRLVFNGYGDKYFLSQIWTTGTQGNQVPKDRAERELMAHNHRPNPAVVAALR